MKLIGKKIIITTTILIGIIFLSYFTFVTTYDRKQGNDFQIDSDQVKIKIDSVAEQEIFSENFPKSSSFENSELIDDVLQAKLDNYSLLGYFPQVYEPSLQATYHALYILDALGKLDEMDHAAVLAYLKSTYDVDLHLFMDDYAWRYVDTDYSKMHYPLSSVLEANCYALLSLALLDRLDVVDSQAFIAYIWSCYNPETSGFIGQAYDPSLPSKARIATMDNTYFALLTLDMLMVNWNDHSSEVSELITFIEGLQSESPAFGRFGGFSNDANASFDSLRIEEPNLISSYYCVKSLALLGGLTGGVISDFWEYLDTTYDATGNFFKLSSIENEYLDLVATAIGVALSDMTGYPSIDREGVISFVLTNRNSRGIWNGSTTGLYSELIDTFQVIRALNDAGEVGRLTEEDENDISSALGSYRANEGGYGPLPHDYTSQELVNAIVNAFGYQGKLSEVDEDYLYSLIASSYLYNSYYKVHSFYSYAGVDAHHTSYRSHPIEYNSIGTHEIITDINEIMDQKSIFMALDSLKLIDMLDEFASGKDLSEISDNVIASQFVEAGYSNSGGFLPSYSASFNPSLEYQNSRVYLTHAYHAVKTLELLDAHLGTNGMGEIDVNALEAYIKGNIVENADTIHYNPTYTDEGDVIMESTYQALYVLQAINRQDLDLEKIENFILQAVDYTSMKSLYYSWKIAELLDLDIPFDIDSSHELLQQVHSEELNEFYLTTGKENIDHEVLAWACEMAANDEVRINHDAPSTVQLGTAFTISASLCNIMLEDFGPYVVVKLESPQLGSITLEKRADNLYQKTITISDEPENYPCVEGNLTACDDGETLSSASITIETTRAPEDSTSDESTEEEKSSNTNQNDSNQVGAEDESSTNVENTLVAQVAFPLALTTILTPGVIIGASTLYKRRLRLKMN